MTTFKSPADFSKLSRNDPAYRVIEELVGDLIVAYDIWEQPDIPEN